MDFSLFSKNELFNNMDDLEIAKIITKFIETDYDKNETIFSEGDTLNSIYIVFEGEVEISKNDYNGNKVIVNIIDDYGVFAESIVFATNNISPYSTQTLVPTKIYSMHIVAFKELLNQNKKLMVNMLNLLANKNVYLTYRLDILSQKTIREKVLEILNHYYSLNKSHIVILPFNKSQLANFISVNRSALERELSKMQEEEIFEYKNQKYYLNKDIFK